MQIKTYFQNLDGLRAFSALAVILFHLQANFGNGQIGSYGYLGVEVFFVISGFLITDILLRMKETKNFFKLFYIRRVLRIFPLYFLCFFFVLAYGIIHSLGVHDFYWYILFLQNWVFGIHENYISFPGMFGHSWTLAIEQQFYLIWPLFIRFIPIKRLIPITAFGIILSIFSRFYLFESYSGTLASYATISHFDTLLGGSFLAILMNSGFKLEEIFKYNILFTLLAGIVYLGYSSYAQMPLFWNDAITSTSSSWPAAMIIFVPLCILGVHFLLITKNHTINSIFSHSWITYLGKISYGIYMYHLIILHIFDPSSHLGRILGYHLSMAFLWILEPWIGDIITLGNYSVTASNIILMLGKIILTILIAHISYQYFEKKFLGFRDKKS